jgi:WD40 repeat protein
VAEERGVIRLTDAGGKPLVATPHREGRVVDLSWNLTGAVLASHHYRGSAKEVAAAIRANSWQTVASDVFLWDAAARPVARLNLPTEQLFRMGWSPDGELLLTLGGGDTADVWTSRGAHCATLHSNGALRDFAWSCNSSFLATSEGRGMRHAPEERSKPQAVRLWNRQGKHVATLPGHRGPIQHLLWHPRRSLLASAGYDRKIRLWTEDGKPLYQLEGHEGPVVRLAWSPDGRLLASLSTDNTVRLWDAAGKPVATLTRAAWSRFPLATRTEEYSGFGMSAEPREFELVWSPDGKRLAATFDGPAARVWLTDFPRLYQEAQARLVEQLNWVRAEVAQPAWEPELVTGWWWDPKSLPPVTPHKSIEGLCQQAASLADQQRWGPAVDALSAALTVQPGRADLLRRRGDAYAAMGDEERAAADYREAAKRR